MCSASYFRSQELQNLYTGKSVKFLANKIYAKSVINLSRNCENTCEKSSMEKMRVEWHLTAIAKTHTNTLTTTLYHYFQVIFSRHRLSFVYIFAYQQFCSTTFHQQNIYFSISLSFIFASSSGIIISVSMAWQFWSVTVTKATQAVAAARKMKAK